MRLRDALTHPLLLVGVFALAIPSLYAAQAGAPADLQWISVKDERIRWLNVADWESKGDGLQPVRVAKAWRDKWPARTAARAQSAAGVTARFRTDSKVLVLRVTFIDVPDSPSTPEVAWERSRPSYFDLYRDGKYVASIPAATKFTQQDVTIYNDPDLSKESEIAVLFSVLLSERRGHRPRHWHRVGGKTSAGRARSPPPSVVSR